jgi:hypothetical protein
MNNIKLNSLIFLVSLFIIYRPIDAQVIYVSGHISNNTSWGDTVKITGDIIVDNGITLTINPGTYVESQGHSGFDVKGRILALGNQSDSICFTINDTTGFSNYQTDDGGWGGFIFQNTPTTNDTSRFEYCKIQYCKRFPNSGGAAFRISFFSKIKILHCKIFKNASGGDGGSIDIYNSTPVIMYNIFERNYSGGHGGAVMYSVNSIVEEFNINFSNNILIYNTALQ